MKRKYLYNLAVIAVGVLCVASNKQKYQVYAEDSAYGAVLYIFEVSLFNEKIYL